MEIGIYTFGDLPPGARGPQATHQRLQDIIQLAQLADQAGLQVFGLGEHHRVDYAVSSPATVLAAIASVTRNIRLTSAVTVLSSDDPVRVYQQFATLDQISSGRAEIMAGRGAFIESFPLFGQSLDDYEALFDEKLGLLRQLTAEPEPRWQGQFRPALPGVSVIPRPYANAAGLPIWIAAGGSPQSAVRAGRLGMPLNLAIIGGAPAQFKPFIDLYRHTGRAAGHDDSALKVAISSHFCVGDDDQATRDAFYPYYARYMRHNLPRGDSGWDLPRSEYDRLTAPAGALFAGDAARIIDKLHAQFELFGHQRFLAQIDIGGQPRAMVERSITLLAERVLPAVRHLGA